MLPLQDTSAVASPEFAGVAAQVLVGLAVLAIAARLLRGGRAND